MIPVVYLCGGINGLSDSECKDWRELTKERLVKTIDPMRRDYRGIERANVEAIVDGDLADINNSTCVLAMCTRPSWGTAMEIFYAHRHGTPVFAVIPPGPVSPWLEYHCHRTFFTLDEAIDAIVSRFYGEGP